MGLKFFISICALIVLPCVLAQPTLYNHTSNGNQSTFSNMGSSLVSYDNSGTNNGSSVSSDRGSVTTIGIVGGDATNMASNGSKAKVAIGSVQNIHSGGDVKSIGVIGGNIHNASSGEGSNSTIRIGAAGTVD
jgi:hypothetical protein